MKWEKPSVCEICVGMEVTGYESADLETDTDLFRDNTVRDDG
jgi:coenzyme PQQ precursor peptide PqqA